MSQQPRGEKEAKASSIENDKNIQTLRYFQTQWTLKPRSHSLLNCPLLSLAKTGHVQNDEPGGSSSSSVQKSEGSTPSYSTSSVNSNDYHRIEIFSALRSETRRAFHLIKCSQENQLTNFRQGQNITAQRVKPPALVKNLQRTRCCSKCFRDQRHQHHLGAC